MEASQTGNAAPTDRKVKSWQRFRGYERDAEVVDAEREHAFRVDYKVVGRARCGQLRPFDVALPRFRRRCADAIVRWVAASVALGAPMLVGAQAQLAELVGCSPRAVRYALDELRGGWVDVVPAFEQCQRGAAACGVCLKRGVGHWRELEHGYRAGPRLLAALAQLRTRLVKSSLSHRLANLAIRRSGSIRTEGRGARALAPTRTGGDELAVAREVVQRQRLGGGRAQPVPVAELLAATREASRSPAAATRRASTPPTNSTQPPRPAADAFCAAAACAAFRDVCGCPACRAKGDRA